MKICIDAGHNYSGYDTGAQGNGLKEQNITFQIADKLKSLLKQNKIEVIMTREELTDNVGINSNDSINARAKLANSTKCDYFVSIHCNAGGGTGTETLIYGRGGKAEPLAKAVNSKIVKHFNLKDRGIKVRTDLGVLRLTNMPAILIETAFIDKASDAKLLAERYNEFAECIYKGICEYLGITSTSTSTSTYTVKNEPATSSNQVEKAKYSIIGTTHVIEIDPRQIWAVETQCSTKKITYDNFVNSLFFMNLANGKTHPQGIMVNAGKVIANNPTHGKPVATLIVYGKDNVQLKYISDITKEKNVWFAVSGYGLYPNLTADKEGFTGQFADVTRAANRPIIGYRKKDNKIVIAVRAGTDAKRAQQTAKNLGLDFAISLDAGGSTTLKVGGKYKFNGDGRKIFGGIIWS